MYEEKLWRQRASLFHTRKRLNLSRPDVLLSILLTFKPIRTGLLACLPVTLLILTDCFLLFWWRGFCSQVAPFPWLMWGAFCCLCSFSFFLSFFVTPDKGSARFMLHCSREVSWVSWSRCQSSQSHIWASYGDATSPFGVQQSPSVTNSSKFMTVL